MAESSSAQSIATNRKARHDFHIKETIEAGLVLTGTEIKSIRAGKVNIADSFARIEKGEAYLYQMDIALYDKGNIHNHDPRRARKLLLHKSEIQRLFQLSAVKGNTLVGLELYWKRGHVKILLGLAQGKTHGDRRQTIKQTEAKREMDRAIKNRLKR
ncbi:MAG: SsrA-binding protein SmpB [Verrucomicrobiae bacterium]|nr:SsrA-binding protein SmpB [Verrucomicrobiae bacterium]